MDDSINMIPLMNGKYLLSIYRLRFDLGRAFISTPYHIIGVVENLVRELRAFLNAFPFCRSIAFFSPSTATTPGGCTKMIHVSRVIIHV